MLGQISNNPKIGIGDALEVLKLLAGMDSKVKQP